MEWVTTAINFVIVAGIVAFLILFAWAWAFLSGVVALVKAKHDALQNPPQPGTRIEPTFVRLHGFTVFQYPNEAYIFRSSSQSEGEDVVEGSYQEIVTVYLLPRPTVEIAKSRNVGRPPESFPHRAREAFKTADEWQAFLKDVRPLREKKDGSFKKACEAKKIPPSTVTSWLDSEDKRRTNNSS